MGDPELLQVFVANGADVMGRNDYESTVLHWAGMCGLAHVVDVIGQVVTLEQLRALLEAVDDLGRTAEQICQDYDCAMALQHARGRLVRLQVLVWRRMMMPSRRYLMGLRHVRKVAQEEDDEEQGDMQQ